MNTLQKSSGLKSLRADNRKWVFIVLGVILVGAAILSLVFGSTDIDIRDALKALLEKDYSDADFRILFYLRLPRMLAALVAGAGLAVSGVLIQAVLHNPMAAPNVIGVNSGAGLAATITIAMFPNALSTLPLVAFVGALLACLLVFAISQKTNASKLTITLVGIAVGSVLNAGINTVKVMFPDSVYDADLFMIGGFSGVTYDKIFSAAIIVCIGLVIAFLLGRDIDVLSLGDHAALSLGVHVRFLRFGVLVIASALAGAAVSFAGLLGFVGLLVPHIMRRFVGVRHRRLVPASALAGGGLVLMCDWFSRILFAPYEIPVGIVLSFIGGIFFICLILFGKRGDVL